MTKIYSDATAETLEALRANGYRWTIESKVDHRVELHNEVTRLNGKVEVYFVAEVDGYGNITEWGETLFDHKPNHLDRRNYFLSADGTQIRQNMAG